VESIKGDDHNHILKTMLAQHTAHRQPAKAFSAAENVAKA